MSNTEHPVQPDPNPTSQHNNNPPLAVNFVPLLTNGPDALQPDEDDDVSNAKLSAIDLSTPNAWHDVITRTGDDLFRSSTAATRRKTLIPSWAKLVRAKLSLYFKDSPDPHPVEMSHAGGIKYQSADDASRAHPYLTKHGLLTILLVTFLALAPTIDDLDDDDDDERSTLSRSHSPRPLTLSNFTPLCPI